MLVLCQYVCAGGRGTRMIVAARPEQVAEKFREAMATDCATWDRRHELVKDRLDPAFMRPTAARLVAVLPELGETRW